MLDIPEWMDDVYLFTKSYKRAIVDNVDNFIIVDNFVD